MIDALKKKPQPPKRKPEAAAHTQDTPSLFGAGLSFAAKEAYKLLRTNITFALPESADGKGKIIGLTSAVRGEGKSTTTLNLASVLAEQGKRVVVVEGDLRLPSLRKKLKVRIRSGLSNVLIARANPLEFLHKCTVGTVDGNDIQFDLLVAGEIPPNPSELLGSRRMEETLGILAKNFDYVLLDLPPVTAVTDALVATKLVDGVVLVVRSCYSDTGSLNEAIRQLQQVNGKILGFVFNCASVTKSGYRSRYKYRYYRDSDYGYR